MVVAWPHCIAKRLRDSTVTSSGVSRVSGLSRRLSEQKSVKARQPGNSQYTLYHGLSTKRTRPFFFLPDVRTYEECS